MPDTSIDPIVAAESPARSDRMRRALLVLGVALGCGVLEAAQGRFFYHDIPNVQFWPEALARTLPSWLALALLVPAVFALARAEAKLRAGLAEARLRALRAQLNPHFLFNTLNAVHALALTGDREQLVTTIRALSDLLRIVLDETPGDQGTVESEMRFLDRYFEIQQVRFGCGLSRCPCLQTRPHPR